MLLKGIATKGQTASLQEVSAAGMHPKLAPAARASYLFFLAKKEVLELASCFDLSVPGRPGGRNATGAWGGGLGVSSPSSGSIATLRKQTPRRGVPRPNAPSCRDCDATDERRRGGARFPGLSPSLCCAALPGACAPCQRPTVPWPCIGYNYKQATTTESNRPRSPSKASIAYCVLLINVLVYATTDLSALVALFDICLC
jgi:hypothetical protein